MKASVSPLQLSFFGFDDVRVVSNDAFDPENDAVATVSPDVEIRLRDGDSDHVVHVNLAVRIDQDCELGVAWDQVPYELKILVVGIFEIIDDVGEEQDFWLKYMNAPAILYGLARSEIARLTTSNRFGQYILPSIDLISMAEDEFEPEIPGDDTASKAESVGDERSG